MAFNRQIAVNVLSLGSSSIHLHIKMNANPSYGVLEDDDDGPVYDDLYELVDQQQRNAGDREVCTVSVSSVQRIVRNIRALRVATAIISIVAVLALLTAIAAVTLTVILPTHASKQDTGGSTPEVTQMPSTCTDNGSERIKTVKTDCTPSTTIQPLKIGTYQRPASSCSELPSNFTSGEYFIQLSKSEYPTKVYCDMNPRKCHCNGTSYGGWTRVGYLDMTNDNHTCPPGFGNITIEYREPLRFCYRKYGHCTSTFYSTHGMKYSQVCGKIVGYQNGRTEAFRGYIEGGQQTIEGAYVDGVSLTYGEPPRQHIWTFASALSEETTRDTNLYMCPCTSNFRTSGKWVPPFIDQDYFCDTGATTLNKENYNGPLLSDPLWDGLGCDKSSNTCCTFNNPPWFCKTLPKPTTEDIELRLCGYSSSPLLSYIEINIK